MVNNPLLALFISITICLGCSRPVSSPEPFTAGPEVFNPAGSHIQGIAASEDALYISQDRHLAKVD